MRNKRSILAIITAVILMIITGCSAASNNESIDYGTLEANKYKNEYFGLSLTLPQTWILQQDEGKQEQKAAKSLDSFKLTAAFKYPAGIKPDFNPSFICMAEKLSALNGIKTSKEYMEAVKVSLEASQLPYEFEKEIYAETIGGKEFYVLDAKINSDELVINQKSFAVILKNYMLTFTYSYSDEIENMELKEIINSVQFE